MITDGDQRSTLAVTRSLGRRNLRVIVGEERRRSLAGCSRYCWKEFTYPSPLFAPRAFQEALLAYTKAYPALLLVPTTDITCSLVAEIREQFPPQVTVALSGGGSYERASKKDQLMRIATDCDVPIPETVFVDDLEHLPDIANSLTYPVVIKPCQSKKLTPQGWVVGGIEYAHSAEELQAKYKHIHEQTPFPLIQERIHGPGCGLFALFAEGRSLALFAHRRLREKPPSGGVSVLRESIPVDQQMRDFSERILSALDWNGVAMVEFKVDQRDGVPKLMEINGRFWGSLQLAVDAGVDFPYLLYQQMVGGEIDPIMTYETGVRTRWLLGDLDHMLITLLHRRRSLSLPADHPGRLRTLWNFCRTAGRRTKLEIWQRDDLRPAIQELQDYCRSGLRGLWAKMR